MNTSGAFHPHSRETNLEQQYRLLLEIIPDVVYRIDTEGKFQFISRSIQDLGWMPEDLIGNHFSTIVHPEDMPNVSRELFLPGRDGAEPEKRRPPKFFDERRTGSRMTKWLELRLVPKGWVHNSTHDSDLIHIGELASVGVYEQAADAQERRFTGTVGIIRDITEKKQEEHARKKLEQQYLQAQRLESLGLLAGGIAHDFKNLLTIATGYLEVTSDQGGPDFPFANHLSRALDALHRSRELTERLLGFSRGSAPEKQPADLVTLLRKTVDLVIDSEKVAVDYDLPAELEPILVDEGQIAQVFENIMCNATHAMPEGGRLSIRACALDIAAGTDLALPQGHYVRISFTDTGSGIPEEHLEKIFDPFFSTKSGGTGLGLATSYFIAQKHGGLITAEPHEGGAVFQVYLPSESREKIYSS